MKAGVKTFTTTCNKSAAKNYFSLSSQSLIKHNIYEQNKQLVKTKNHQKPIKTALKTQYFGHTNINQQHKS